MRLVRPQSIPEIDALWRQKYFLSEEALIRRAGDAVASAILSLGKEGEVLVLSGGGNNGADGYATALSLLRAGVRATVVDVFGKGQRSEGGRAARCRKFAYMLSERTGLTVAMFDERMTTMTASRYLNETNTRGKKRKTVIDTLSAQIILQNCLDRLKYLN